MSTSPREARFARRLENLYASDAQFAAARPSQAVAEAAGRAGLGLPQVIQTLMEGYADRPAVGQRAVRFVTDASGRTSFELLPRFETITYRELWDRITAFVTALTAEHAVRPGDRVCLLGFTSVDFTTIDIALARLGAVSVPLQTGAAITQLLPIVTETEPSLIAVNVDNLSDAVELVLSGHPAARVVVFDHRPEVDVHRENVDAARARLAGTPVVVETLAEVIERGTGLTGRKGLEKFAPVEAESATDDPLALLIYTSGSTGAPKGAMSPASRVANYWRKSSSWFCVPGAPSITLNFMPMSHVMGRQVLYGTLGNGGTAYFVAKSDLSTLFEDLALVRPSELNFVPRIWDMLYGEFHSEVDRRYGAGDPAADEERAALEAQVKAELRENLLGGRCVAALTASAPISAEMRAWVDSMLDDVRLAEGYGSTEAGMVLVDGRIRRPAVADYKLVDVPELGYFGSDRPHPRGELAVKIAGVFPGYYKRPETTAEVFDADGFYLTGDVMAEVGPEQFVYLDRRNNVLKLSQGEFVTVSKLETLYADSPLVRQIYIYGNSARAYVLAAIVPTDDALARCAPTELKRQIGESLQEIAKANGLQSYEIPRDFIIDATPWTLENGLLTGVRKVARPQLKKHYGERLEQLYTDLADDQANELRALRRSGADAPVLDTLSRAAAALLGTASTDVRPDAHFADLGGDSLSALSFANLLREIFEVDVPVGVITSPASDLAALADYIAAARQPGSKRPSYASVHRGVHGGATEVHASDLTLDKFIDTATLAAAASLPAPSAQVRTVLLTGATGFLGRYLALEWLERMAMVGGKVICLVRAKSDEDARARLDRTFDGGVQGDPKLVAHYQRLAADRLEVIAGDKGEADLGLDRRTWQRLADTVDLIVDPAALVNHVLPYSQLFGPNALGTAELIRLALTTKQKRYVYTSTIAVGYAIERSAFTEDADIRAISARRGIDDSYANGYANSKWAGEVLLREAHDLCGLPVTVFRCDMILADTSYAGQLNVPDTFTRLMLSLAATGIAPGSFYELSADGNRQRAHYDGLPVEFVAEAISTLGAEGNAHDQAGNAGFRTYHVMNPYDDGVGFDEFVDWLDENGSAIQRIADYGDWLARFETALRALPQRQRHASLLPLMHNYQKPSPPVCGSIAPADRFRAAVQDAKIGPDKDIPHITPQIIAKYVSDLRLLGLL
jgi:fatty acid CoA ligase FadD9